MKKEWLDKLQTSVQNEHDVKAPEGLLDDIKKEMARRGVAPVPPTRKKAQRLSLWLYRSVSVAAVVAVCLYLGNIIIAPYSMPEQIASVTKDKANSNPHASQNGYAASYDSSNNKETAAPIWKNSRKAKGKTLLAYHSDANKNVAQIIVKTNEGDNNHTPPGCVEPSAKNNTTDSSTKTPQKGNDVGTYSYGCTDYYVKSSRLSIATSYSGATGTANNGERLLLSTADPYGHYDPEFSGEKAKSDEIITQVKHRQPIKFGISMRYNLNHHWSLQTGLTYSSLISDFSFGKGAGRHSERQTLHYIGLPVNVSYSFVKTKRFNAYATAGGEIEKLVKGESKQIEGNDPREKQSGISIKESRPIFSLNAAIGGEYRFSKDVSAYVEPGVSYHFNNGSSVKNIYKDKPTNFNLNIGIRVNLNK